MCFESIAITSYVFEYSIEKSYLSLVIRDIIDGVATPCGSCRQILAEFDLDIDVHLINTKNESKTYKLRELLPLAFTPKDLEKTRGK